MREKISLKILPQMGEFNKWGEPLYESVILGLIVAVVCMIVATAVGRAIPRLRKPGGVLLVALIPLFVPGLTMGAALFISIRSLLELRLGVGGWAGALCRTRVRIKCTRTSSAELGATQAFIIDLRRA